MNVIFRISLTSNSFIYIVLDMYFIDLYLLLNGHLTNIFPLFPFLFCLIQQKMMKYFF